MAQLTTAFLGVAHIHTPGFIRTLNKRADEIRVKAVYDAQAERGQRRAGNSPARRSSPTRRRSSTTRRSRRSSSAPRPTSIGTW